MNTQQQRYDVVEALIPQILCGNNNTSKILKKSGMIKNCKKWQFEDARSHSPK